MVCAQSSNDVIGPYLKPKWYADCKELAKRSYDAVLSMEQAILPEGQEGTWNDWLVKIIKVSMSLIIILS